MLLSVELPLVLQSLECLLGGEAAQAPAERHLTEIDWVLTRGVLDSIVHQLSVAWDELGGTELMRGDVDIEGDAGVLTPIGEPTLSVALEVKLDGLASAVSLLIPWGGDRADHQQHPRRRRRAAPRRSAGRRRAASRCRRRTGAAARRGRLRADADRADARAHARLRCWSSATAPRTACCCSPRASRSGAGARGEAARAEPSS